MSEPQDAAPPVLHQPATSPDATAAPNPRNTVRRGNDIFVMIMLNSSRLY